MCSACSGDPEDPPAAREVTRFGLLDEDDSPLWGRWKEVEEEDLDVAPAERLIRRGPHSGEIQGRQ